MRIERIRKEKTEQMTFSELIAMQKQNSINDICANRGRFCVYLNEFLLIQLEWINTQIDNNPDSEYWYQVIFDKEIL